MIFIFSFIEEDKYKHNDTILLDVSMSDMVFVQKEDML